MKSKECMIIEEYSDESLLYYNVTLKILPVQVQQVILHLMLLYNHLLFYLLLLPPILSIILTKKGALCALFCLIMGDYFKIVKINPPVDAVKSILLKLKSYGSKHPLIVVPNSPFSLKCYPHSNLYAYLFHFLLFLL